MTRAAAPNDYGTWFTTGSWATELESVAVLDRLVISLELFRIHREVPGTLTQPRPGQIERALRIDRILVPNATLLAEGWEHGAIGVECKRSGVSIGPPLAQAMDYVRGSWHLNGVWLQLGAVFLWPMHKQSGPLASLMAHNREGAISPMGVGGIHFSIGEEVPLVRSTFGGVSRIRHSRPRAGHKVGSR